MDLGNDENDQQEEERQQHATTHTTTMISQPLSEFLRVLLEENASLANAEIVDDPAPMMPDRHSQSYLMMERHSSSISSMPELSRWESHAVRTPPAVVDRQRERQQLHASPSRPQRRTSFEVDRSSAQESLLTGGSDSISRRALSQSLSQLSTLREGTGGEVVQQERLRTLPPRVPIRRASGRVQSPPPPEVRGSDNDGPSSTFQLDFSESEHYSDNDEDETATATATASLHNDLQSLSLEARRRSNVDTVISESALSRRHQSRMNNSRLPSRQHSENNNNAQHVRTSFRSHSLSPTTSEAARMPTLEGFPKHPPHQRSRTLPRQAGSLDLLRDTRSSLLSPAVESNNTAPDTEPPVQLTKVASSKVLPARRAYDVGEQKPAAAAEMSPTTVQKAVKTTILGRMKNRVKSKSAHNNKAPPVRHASPVRHDSGDTATTHITAQLEDFGGDPPSANQQSLEQT